MTWSLQALLHDGGYGLFLFHTRAFLTTVFPHSADGETKVEKLSNFALIFRLEQRLESRSFSWKVQSRVDICELFSCQINTEIGYGSIREVLAGH